MAKKIQNKDKKKAWDEFSRFVRIRDCLATTGLPFVGVCVTCGRRFHLRYLQAGHCLPGRTNAKLFDPKLTHAQCKWCNEFKHGEREKYEAAMIKKWGKEIFDDLVVETNKVIHNDDMDFPVLRKEYREKYESMMRKYGFRTYSELLQGIG